MADRLRTTLVIAGSDSSGGAGIQADLRVLYALGVYGATAITAVTAQNTRGVRRIDPVPVAGLRAQIEAVLDDLPIDAIKVGMLGSAAHASTVAELLARVTCPIVVDPVMIATTGARLLDEDAVAVLRDELLPLAALATPNRAEMAVLGGVPCPVLITGGDAEGAEVTDTLVNGAYRREWTGPRVPVPTVHGTGCTLATAIAAGLACGLPLEVAVDRAIGWTRARIAEASLLGGGAWVLGHGLCAVLTSRS